MVKLPGVAYIHGTDYTPPPLVDSTRMGRMCRSCWHSEQNHTDGFCWPMTAIRGGPRCACSEFVSVDSTG